MSEDEEVIREKLLEIVTEDLKHCLERMWQEMFLYGETSYYIKIDKDGK